MRNKFKMLKERRPRLRGKRKAAEAEAEIPLVVGLPRITNETLAVHREQVLKGARKYIYPLQHSRHKIVTVSLSLFIAATVGFFGFCVLSLYRFQSTSPFMYRVTQVIPFPIARSGSSFVAYENYLFELRHYMHYYETQQKLSFQSTAGKQQLAEFKKRALDRVVDDAYVKRLAKQHSVTVSDKEVDDQITLLRSQNRLGSSDSVFRDVLKEFWGWSVDDFKRSVRQQLLAQKLAATLDTDTPARATAALGELKAGADFGATAKKYSDDVATKDNGGEFGFLIDHANRDIPAQTLDALYRLPPGQYSDILNIGYALQIVKNIEQNGDKVKAAHILFNFKDVDTYVNDAKDKQKTRVYIHLQKAATTKPTDTTPTTTPAKQ